jgi:Tol biopolymer transport system component
VSARRLLPLFCLVLALGGVSSAGATTPGANGRIAFTIDDGHGSSELYSANADGSATRRLTWTAQSEQAPAWSPDGTRIAYESSLGGRYRIWAMNADGSAQTQLTSSSGSIADDEDPAWSPDGTQIAFGSTRGGNWNLWVMNADGGGLRQVSTVFGDDPAWSPDGHRLAYLGLDGIGVVGVDGSNPHTVSAPGASASGPSWSPDGTQIVFSRNNAAGFPGELFVANADGSGEHQLTSDGYSNARASWSPDGTQIVFQRTTTPPFGWSLWTIGAGGTGLRQVTSSGNALGPDWGSSQVVPEPSPPDAPMIQIYSPDPGTFYLPTSQAPAFYLCSSFVSYIVSCVGDVPFGMPLDLAQAGTRTFTVRAVDAEGRTATASVSYQVFDIVPPKIELRAPVDGATYELDSDVKVDYACTDPNGTGVAYCAGDRPSGYPLDTSQTGIHNFTVYALDNSHNFSQVHASYNVVDSRPTVQIASPSNGATYTLGDMVPAGYSCHSAPDTQLVTCGGPVPNGSAFDTGSVGSKTFRVTATNDRGKTASLTIAYTVVYAFRGFDSPVSAAGSIDTAKAGDSVPLKFSLSGNQGLAAVTRTTSQPASCIDWSALGAATATQTKLSYSASLDRYLDVVATDASWKGSCRTLDLELADGTHHAVHVHFTK